MLNYSVKTYTFKQLKKSIVVPKFQRNLVWNKDRKRSFIRTILNGDPFGVLLIYSNPQTHNEQIIDGLQRFTTLMSFESKPFELLEFDEFDFEEFKLITFKILQYQTFLTEDAILTGVIDDFKDTVQEHNFIDELVPRDEFKKIYLKKLRGRFFEIKDTIAEFSIENDVSEIWRKLKDKISLDHIEIPIIVYQGDERNLPDLFERLNTGGTKLSKYEVFSSSWSNNVLTKMDTRITKEVDKKYMALIEDTQLDIENYTEGLIELTGEVTLYEFCYALGKLIKQKNEHIFGKKSSVVYASVDSIGFSSIASALELHLQDMPELNKIVTDKISTSKLKRFVDAILDSYAELSEILYLNRMTFNKYIEAQIISMAMTLFKINYDFDKKSLETVVNNTRRSTLEKFKKHATLRYFHDMIRGYWSGNGDNKLYEIVSSTLENNRYLSPIDEDTWRYLLKEWFNDILLKKPKTPLQESKVFLGMIYVPLNEKDDFEKLKQFLIIPKAILEKNLIKDNYAHPANLFLLNNQLKEYTKDLILDERDLNISLGGSLDYFPKIEELEKFKTPFNEKTYLDFLNKRIEILIEAFISIIN
jgi:hypothetical protein